MFQNREEAGMLLAVKLPNLKNRKDAVILAIPRGGVVVGRVVAQKLNLPLSVIVVKKLGAPNNPELAIGAIAPSGTKVVDWDLALRLGVEQDYLDEEIKRKQKEVEEREKKLEIKKLRNLGKYKIVILVDDGVATGATTLAAIKYLKKPRTRIILAIPVIARDTYNRIKSEVDEIIALEIPEFFGAVGEFYREFPQVSDEEVIKYLK